MRVLMVTGSYPPQRCGVGDYTAALVRSLRAAGATAGVLTGRGPAGPDAAEDPDVLRDVPSWRRRSLPAALRVVRRWRPDVVHVQYPTQGYDGVLPRVLPLAVRTALRTPVVQTLHEYHGERLRFPLLQFLGADAFVVVRPDYVARIRPWFRWAVRGRPVVEIPNASSIPRATLTPTERDALRSRLGANDRALVAYFGFLYPDRGVEQVFGVTDPTRHKVLIVGGPHPDFPDYPASLEALAERRGFDATFTGYLDDDETARVLAAADAVVLPFVRGGGGWNTSIHAATLQGTFVLTTSASRRGYDEREHIHYARPGDLGDLRAALSQHLGVRRAPDAASPTAYDWADIARAHLELYGRAVGPERSRPSP